MPWWLPKAVDFFQVLVLSPNQCLILIQEKLQVATWFWFWWFLSFKTSDSLEANRPIFARLIVVECIDFALEGLLQAILQVESIGQRLCGQPMKILSAWGEQNLPQLHDFFWSQVTLIYLLGSVICYKDHYHINRPLSSADMIRI